MSNNVHVYGPSGNLLADNGNNNFIELIDNKCKSYDNYVSISRRVVSNENLENFDTYLEL